MNAQFQSPNNGNVVDLLNTLGKQAKTAAAGVSISSAAIKNIALLRLAALIRANMAALQADNGKDIANAIKAGLSEPMVDRLKLTPKVLETCAQGCEQLSAMPDIIGEIIVRVNHHLLALPGVKLEQVKRVHSHPQALAQSDGFVAKHHLIPIPAFDTAGAAKELLERGATDEAVIASKRAGELYGLSVLAAGIEDEDFNYTRFLVLSIKEI